MAFCQPQTSEALVGTNHKNTDFEDSKRLLGEEYEALLPHIMITKLTGKKGTGSGGIKFIPEEKTKLR